MTSNGKFGTNKRGPKRTRGPVYGEKVEKVFAGPPSLLIDSEVAVLLRGRRDHCEA